MSNAIQLVDYDLHKLNDVAVKISSLISTIKKMLHTHLLSHSHINGSMWQYLSLLGLTFIKK